MSKVLFSLLTEEKKVMKRFINIITIYQKIIENIFIPFMDSDTRS